jgi:hypothetical protein
MTGEGWVVDVGRAKVGDGCEVDVGMEIVVCVNEPDGVQEKRRKDKKSKR